MRRLQQIYLIGMALAGAGFLMVFWGQPVNGAPSGDESRLDDQLSTVLREAGFTGRIEETFCHGFRDLLGGGVWVKDGVAAPISAATHGPVTSK